MYKFFAIGFALLGTLVIVEIAAKDLLPWVYGLSLQTFLVGIVLYLVFLVFVFGETFLTIKKPLPRWEKLRGLFEKINKLFSLGVFVNGIMAQALVWGSIIMVSLFITEGIKQNLLAKNNSLAPYPNEAKLENRLDNLERQVTQLNAKMDKHHFLSRNKESYTSEDQNYRYYLNLSPIQQDGDHYSYDFSFCSRKGHCTASSPDAYVESIFKVKAKDSLTGFSVAAYDVPILKDHKVFMVSPLGIETGYMKLVYPGQIVSRGPLETYHANYYEIKDLSYFVGQDLVVSIGAKDNTIRFTYNTQGGKATDTFRFLMDNSGKVTCNPTYF